MDNRKGEPIKHMAPTAPEYGANIGVVGVEEAVGGNSRPIGLLNRISGCVIGIADDTATVPLNLHREWPDREHGLDRERQLGDPIVLISPCRSAPIYSNDGGFGGEDDGISDVVRQLGALVSQRGCPSKEDFPMRERARLEFPPFWRSQVVWRYPLRGGHYRFDPDRAP